MSDASTPHGMSDAPHSRDPGRASPSPSQIRQFWDRNPVNADFFAGADPEDRAFFDAYDARRQATEGHIRLELERLPLAGARVLEIGLGHGTESQFLAERAGEYTGVDLTPESLRRVRRRFQLFDLARPRLALTNAERLPFGDAAFDLVFSHGVIHHSPRIHEIVAEIHRVLRPGGLAVIMVYHRNSLNYHLSIRLLRRAGIFALALPGVTRAVARLTGEPSDRLAAHTANLRRQGLAYLRMDNFVHYSTDGPHNVFSSVWSEPEARSLFARFTHVQCRRHFLNERHLPGLRTLLPQPTRDRLAARLGWHLWIFATR